MNEEPATPLAPAPAKAERRGTESMWLRTLDVIRKNKAATLLPLTVTQVPFAVVTAAVFFYLFFGPYPEARFDSFNWLADAPGGLRLTIVLLGAAQSLFSLVGAYYYLRIVKLMYFDEPVEGAAAPTFDSQGKGFRLLMSANGLALLVLGLLPETLMSLCFVAMKSLWPS